MELKRLDKVGYEVGKAIAERLQKTEKYEKEPVIKKYKFSWKWWDVFAKNYKIERFAPNEKQFITHT